MVGAARFELATSRSQTERSTKLSHAPSFSGVSYKKHTQVPNSTSEKFSGQVKVRENRANTELFSSKPVPDGLFAALYHLKVLRKFR